MSGITDCTVADIFNYMEKVNEKHICVHAQHCIVIWIHTHIGAGQQKKL